MVPFNRHGKWGAEQALSSPLQQRAGPWPGGDGGDTEPRTRMRKRGKGKQGTEMPQTHHTLRGWGDPRAVVSPVVAMQINPSSSILGSFTLPWSGLAAQRKNKQTKKTTAVWTVLCWFFISAPRRQRAKERPTQEFISDWYNKKPIAKWRVIALWSNLTFLGGRGPYWHFSHLPVTQLMPWICACWQHAPFLTYLSLRAGKQARRRRHSSCAENSCSEANTQGVFFFSCQSHEDLGTGLALLAPTGRSPWSLITSAHLTRAPHVLGALHS